MRKSYPAFSRSTISRLNRASVSGSWWVMAKGFFRNHGSVSAEGAPGLGRLYSSPVRTNSPCPATEAELLGYIRTGDPMDKAGAYGVQGKGALLVEKLNGDFFNVMGLPVLRLSRMLGRFGVSFFD